MPGHRSASAALSRGAKFHLVIFSSWCEELGVTLMGKLFCSLALPGRLETDSEGAGNPGIRVACGPRPGRRAWWGQKVTDLLAVFLHRPDL